MITSFLWPFLVSVSFGPFLVKLTGQDADPERPPASPASSAASKLSAAAAARAHGAPRGGLGAWAMTKRLPTEEKNIMSLRMNMDMNMNMKMMMMMTTMC